MNEKDIILPIYFSTDFFHIEKNSHHAYFFVYWDSLEKKSDIQFLENSATLYGKKIGYKKETRYLGAW